VFVAGLPTYEECMTMDHVDIRHNDDSEFIRGELKWRPRYPMYRQLSESQGPSAAAAAAAHVYVDFY